MTRTGVGIKPSAFVLVLILSSSAVFAQRDEGRWLRVITGEYSIVEVDRTSLKVGADNSLSAVFKTTFSQSEGDPLQFNSGTTRLDTVEFSVKEKKYRIVQSNPLDRSGTQPASSNAGTPGEWKKCMGKACLTMYSAAKQLNPYGTWKVTGYRYATGQPAGPDDPQEIKELKDADIWLKAESLMVGKMRCNISDFDGRTVTESEWRSYFGTSLREFGLGSGPMQALRFTCGPDNSSSQRNFLLRLDQERAILLWEGVFLDIKRVPLLFIP